MEHGGVATTMTTVVEEFDLHDILEQSVHAVSQAQWEIITRLIIHASDTHTSLSADARLMSALFIDSLETDETRPTSAVTLALLHYQDPSTAGLYVGQ